jgi:hypothetical protein
MGPMPAPYRQPLGAEEPNVVVVLVTTMVALRPPPSWQALSSEPLCTPRAQTLVEGPTEGSATTMAP